MNCSGVFLHVVAVIACASSACSARAAELESVLAAAFQHQIGIRTYDFEFESRFSNGQVLNQHLIGDFDKIYLYTKYASKGAWPDGVGPLPDCMIFDGQEVVNFYLEESMTRKYESAKSRNIGSVLSDPWYWVETVASVPASDDASKDWKVWEGMLQKVVSFEEFESKALIRFGNLGQSNSRYYVEVEFDSSLDWFPVKTRACREDGECIVEVVCSAKKIREATGQPVVFPFRTEMNYSTPDPYNPSVSRDVVKSNVSINAKIDPKQFTDAALPAVERKVDVDQMNERISATLAGNSRSPFLLPGVLILLPLFIGILFYYRRVQTFR